MEAAPVWGLTSEELAEAVSAVDSAAFLIPARILRRVIKQHRQLDDLARVPHRKSYVIHRGALLQIATRFELGIAESAPLPETMILLPALESEKLAAITRPRALRKYWRLLFHARVHVELDQLTEQGKLDQTALRERIEKLGALEFEEIRAVLKQEDMLLPPLNDRTVYIEFVAVYLELKCFAPRLLTDYFPAIRDWHRVQELVAKDISAEKLLAETRLPGSPEPTERTVSDEDSSAELQAVKTWFQPQKQSERAYCQLMDRADRARQRGNHVRSAMYRWRAALWIGPKLARQAREAAHDDLGQLARRLGEALELSSQDVLQWSGLLTELLIGAASGVWTAEGRLLYDLQKVCVDHERGVYALDTMRWITSRGKVPLRRPLPNLREVLMSKHLVGAINRLGSVRLATIHRDRLAYLLRKAKKQAETRLRETFRPQVTAALDEVGLDAMNPPEVIARRKLIEELLDRIVERGFFSMGDFRDAISRNQLKLPDVADAHELWVGDQLLRADRRLGELLDGVYRPGEIYLRWPQSLSSLAFGTKSGRWLTKYAALTYGGAFVVLEFVQHLTNSILGFAGRPHIHFRTSIVIGLLGTFFLLLYLPGFRRGVHDALRAVYQLFYQPLVALPLRILRSPWVKRIWQSEEFRKVLRFGIKPAALALPIAGAVSLFQRHLISWPAAFACFLGTNLLLNSRWGRIVDEYVTDLAVRSWNEFRIRVLAAAFHAIVEFFNQILESAERFFYTIDEWLRFRSGDSPVASTIKAALGFVWFFVHYLLRFCLTLLVEPQINPVKHFPVVTVSHKVILPMGPFFVSMFEPYVGLAEANALVWSTIWLIPGVFGFLIWELKENWRLYAANRSPVIKPAVVGRHGESIVRFLRTGFHSGTVPKLFQRLRRSDRKSESTGDWREPRQFHAKLQDVRELTSRFVDRDLLALVMLSPHWRDSKLHLHEMHLGLHSLRLAISGAAPFHEPLWITLEEKSGWLTARQSNPEWLDKLSLEQSRPLRTALAGWFKMCGVELVHEQIEACFEPHNLRYDLYDNGLIVWTNLHDDAVVIYNLRDDGRDDATVSPSSPSSLPTLDRQRLIFAAAPIRWRSWVELWQREVGESNRPAKSTSARAESSTERAS